MIMIYFIVLLNLIYHIYSVNIYILEAAFMNLKVTSQFILAPSYMKYLLHHILGGLVIYKQDIRLNTFKKFF